MTKVELKRVSLVNGKTECCLHVDSEKDDFETENDLLVVGFGCLSSFAHARKLGFFKRLGLVKLLLGCLFQKTITYDSHLDG